MYENRHYEWLKGTPADDGVAADEEAPTCGHRGGGDGDEAPPRQARRKKTRHHRRWILGQHSRRKRSAAEASQPRKQEEAAAAEERKKGSAAAKESHHRLKAKEKEEPGGRRRLPRRHGGDRSWRTRRRTGRARRAQGKRTSRRRRILQNANRRRRRASEKAEGHAEEPRRPTEATYPRGLTRKENEGGGDCLFQAMAQASKEIPGSQPDTADLLRAICVNHLCYQETTYKPYWDGMAPTGEDTPAKSWDHYLNRLSRKGAWAGYLEIHGLAAALDRRITVCQVDGTRHDFNKGGRTGHTWLLYQRPTLRMAARHAHRRRRRRRARRAREWAPRWWRQQGPAGRPLPAGSRTADTPGPHGAAGHLADGHARRVRRLPRTPPRQRRHGLRRAA